METKLNKEQEESVKIALQLFDNTLSNRLDELKSHLNKRFDEQSKRSDGHDKRLDEQSKRSDGHDRRIDDLSYHTKNRFIRVMGALKTAEGVNQVRHEAVMKMLERQEKLIFRIGGGILLTLIGLALAGLL